MFLAIFNPWIRSWDEFSSRKSHSESSIDRFCAALTVFTGRPNFTGFNISQALRRPGYLRISKRGPIVKDDLAPNAYVQANHFPEQLETVLTRGRRQLC